jgi:hypothetical protein
MNFELKGEGLKIEKKKGEREEIYSDYMDYYHCIPDIVGYAVLGA